MTSEIPGTEKVIRTMGRWAPGDLAYIERVDFNTEGGQLTIVGLWQPRTAQGWPDIDAGMRRVTLRFDGVRGLHLKGFGTGCVQIMGFDIRAISDRGWENVSFEVEDYEEGRIGFICSHAKVLEVEDSDTYLP